MAEPPEDAPPPEEQDQAIIDAGFEPAPEGAALCGFGFPIFALTLNIPGFVFPPPGFPPELNLALSLNCDLDDPLDAELSFGGGRVPQQDPDADPDDENSPDT